MIEITKDNYKDIDFNGVIISVPREHLKEELTQDFCLHFECAYYTKGEHGYKEPGYSPGNSSFFSIWYGDNDMPNGFGFNSTSRLPWDEEYMHFNNVRYYKFEDMKEFCFWYLKRQSLLPEDIYAELKEIGSIPMSDFQIKGLDDYIKQNRSFSEIPEELIEKLHSREQRIQSLCKKVEHVYDTYSNNFSEGDPTRVSLSTWKRIKQESFDPLKPIKLSKEAFNKIEETENTPITEEEKKSIEEIKEKADKEWIHEKCGTNTPPTSVPEHPSKGNKKSSLLDINGLNDEIAQNVLRHMIREALKEAVQKDKPEELNKINGESIYWDIYCENETTPEMREKIENIYPEFKEQYAKSIKQYDGEELKLYSPKEISDKINPGWNTRKNKYSDILEYIEMRLDLMQASNNLSESSNYQEQQKYQYIIEQKQKKIDKWLNEENV